MNYGKKESKAESCYKRIFFCTYATIKKKYEGVGSVSQTKRANAYSPNNLISAPLFFLR